MMYGGYSFDVHWEASDTVSTIPLYALYRFSTLSISSLWKRLHSSTYPRARSNASWFFFWAIYGSVGRPCAATARETTHSSRVGLAAHRAVDHLLLVREDALEGCHALEDGLDVLLVVLAGGV